MGLYSFYNAPLIEVAISRNESSIGFVDDSVFLVTGKALDEAHTTIKDMMEHQDGGFKWSISHNLPFELSKISLMDFP